MAEKGFNVNAGGGVIRGKPMPYSPPTGTKPADKPRTNPQPVNHGCCGTQGRH